MDGLRGEFTILLRMKAVGGMKNHVFFHSIKHVIRDISFYSPWENGGIRLNRF